jgi:hypothetical protein
MTDDAETLGRALEMVCQELWGMSGFLREISNEDAVGWALQTYDLEYTYAYCRVRGCEDDEG